MRTIIAALLLTLASALYADWVIMTPEEQELNDRFPAVATRDDAVTAFNSRHYLLQQKAIEWLILHRDITTWETLKNQKQKLKEVSRQLYPILDYLADQPAEPNKPLALILPRNHFDLLVKKGGEVPPRYEYAHLAPPADEVLYRILAEDISRIPNSNELNKNAARLLLEYRSPTDKLEQSIKLKAFSGNSDKSAESPLGDPNQKSQKPAQLKSASTENPATVAIQSTSSDPSENKWIVATVAFFFALMAALYMMRKKLKIT